MISAIDFDFGTVGFPFFGWVPSRSTFCGLSVSRLVRFAGVSGRVADFGARSRILAGKLLRQGCRCRRLRVTFSGYCRRRFELVSKFKVGLRFLLQRGLSEPEFYDDLVCELKKKCC